MDIIATAAVYSDTSDIIVDVVINLASFSNVVLSTSQSELVLSNALVAYAHASLTVSEITLGIPIVLQALCSVVTGLIAIRLIKDLLDEIDYPGYVVKTTRRGYNSIIY